MLASTNPLVVRVFINTANNGWSERWPIWATDWPTGLAIANLIVAARSRLLCSNSSIVWASLATIVPPYIEQGIIESPIGPLPQWGPNTVDKQGILFHLSSMDGYYNPRLLRAVDIAEYQGNQWIRRYLTLPPDPPALPADVTTASKDLLWQNALATFRTYAAECKPISEGPMGPDRFLVGGYDAVSYAQLGTRNVGAKYRRASWEGQHRANAPPFSPCGMVVTVLRRCYQEPCRFYTGQVSTGIRYYWSKSSALVLPIPTVFYGWARAKENVYHGGPGETAQYRSAFQTSGWSVSNAPGIAYTGAPADFIGEGTVSWTPYIPTPAGRLPACDFNPIPPLLYRPVPLRNQWEEIMRLRKKRFRQLPGGTRPHIDGPTPPPFMAPFVNRRLQSLLEPLPEQFTPVARGRGGVTYTAPPPPTFSVVAGATPGTLTFASAITPGFPFSLSYWCRYTSTDAGIDHFAWNNDSTKWLSTINGSANTYLAVQTPSNQWALVGSGIWNDHLWHNSVWTYDGAGTWTLYIDGVSVGASGSGASPTIFGHEIDIQKAEVTQVRVYNRILSSGDAANLAALIEVATGLVGRWKFDEGSGATAYDSIGVNNITLGGAATWSTDYP